MDRSAASVLEGDYDGAEASGLGSDWDCRHGTLDRFAYGKDGLIRRSLVVMVVVVMVW